MNIYDYTKDILDIYSSGSFDFNKWKNYINSLNKDLGNIILNDFNNMIKYSNISYENDIVLILDNVYSNKKLRMITQENFKIIKDDLSYSLKRRFNKKLEVDIILYLGLCNGAGWVVEVNNKTYILLGIEKILELNWHDIDSLTGLIYHELGHVYQSQYGILKREFSNNYDKFLWQLFIEGIAMYFTQMLKDDYEYFYQDKKGWKNWCDKNIDQIKNDFSIDLYNMTDENQRYFGDWVYYKNHSDVGYYLGARFIQFICKNHKLDDVISYDIIKVNKLFQEYLNK